jgi:hypothetical protein
MAGMNKNWLGVSCFAGFSPFYDLHLTEFRGDWLGVQTSFAFFAFIARLGYVSCLCGKDGLVYISCIIVAFAFAFVERGFAWLCDTIEHEGGS